MSINLNIQEKCRSRGITRLCHFTPSRNLAHIIAGKTGILATSHLEDSERLIFNPTDIDRYNGYKSHICCSIEYPNGWYFAKKRAEEVLFRDWVILLIKPDYIWDQDTLFCHRNAAAAYGSYVKKGYDGFQQLYQNSVVGTGCKTWTRSSTHLSACPTDNQAEVLVPDCIKLEDVIGVAVRDETQAKNEVSRIKIQKLEINIDIYIAPAFYDKYALSGAIRCGVRPDESLFYDGGHHDR